MSDLTIVKVQKVRRGVVRLKRREILRAEVRIRLFAREYGEQKRKIGIVAVQQVEPAEILNIIARDGYKESIQLVVGLGE